MIFCFRTCGGVFKVQKMPGKIAHHILNWTFSTEHTTGRRLQKLMPPSISLSFSSRQPDEDEDQESDERQEDNEGPGNAADR